MRRLSFLLLTFALTVGSAASAQEEPGVLAERLDRLERDLSFVQKQVYRGGAAGGDHAAAGSAAVPVNAGQLQVRLGQLDEELRQMRGLIEQTQFQNKQTAAAVKKISDDVDYRLRALEQKQAETAAAPAPTPALEAAAPATETEAAKPTEAATYQPEEKDGKTKPALTGKDFPNANAHYSHAFKLLNDKKYAEAAASFDAFVKKYPADPLTSNAYYWLGESQFARNDFTRSSESFRKGFEANPDAQKAPDNLYKLAMSLSQIKRTSEACIVLAQVVSKYGETAARTAAKATEARTSLQCK